MLFIKNIKILYFLVSFMSVFVAMNSKFITLILAGKDGGIRLRQLKWVSKPLLPSHVYNATEV